MGGLDELHLNSSLNAGSLGFGRFGTPLVELVCFSNLLDVRSIFVGDKLIIQLQFERLSRRNFLDDRLILLLSDCFGNNLLNDFFRNGCLGSLCFSHLLLLFLRGLSLGLFGFLHGLGLLRLLFLFAFLQERELSDRQIGHIDSGVSHCYHLVHMEEGSHIGGGLG